jgi:flagellar basal-body rod modification protein FlgD
MQVTSATSAARSAAASTDNSATAPAVAKKKSLGQDDFLKLLAVQFQQQDPMKPMEDTAFIAQMAQFTTLDQSTSLLAQITQMNLKQDAATANSYIGRHVTVADGRGGTVSGDVVGVETADGTPRLVIGDSTYGISSVLLVEPVTTSGSAPTS